MKLDFITDPGHGWLKVPRALLRDLGIEDRITAYSYQRGEFAYLEEDRDAGIFLEACKARGIAVALRERNAADKRSRIRNYPHFTKEI